MADEGKFVGGAELARRNARKRTATRILRPGETAPPNKDYLSKKMPSMERFFASMLKSPTSHFVNTSHDGRNRLMGDICRRLGLPQPSKVQAEYGKAAAHFESRAALVMEESRHAISESLSSLWRRGGNNTGIRVSLTSMETRKERKHVVFNFEKNTPFTARELYDIRPGCCFEILLPGEASIDRSFLASVVSTSRDFDEDQKQQKRIQLMVFASFGDLPKGGQFRIRHVAALISNVRQFEACTNHAQRVPFLHALLGRKGATHTRFTDDGEEDAFSRGSDEDGEEKKEEDDLKCIDSDDDDDISTINEVFSLPTLNTMQESASRTYLRSLPGSIKVIQGPPGTGKSTLLVSIICRYLTESAARGIKRRLMVCAPTNKAVTVLVTRYLESIRSINENPFNAVLIGEQDKLLNEEQALLHSHETNVPAFRIKKMFVYTWIRGVVDDCRHIKHIMDSGHADTIHVANRVLILCFRVAKSLSSSLDSVAPILDSLRLSALASKNEDEIFPSSFLFQQWDKGLKDLAEAVQFDLDPTQVVRELLDSADVIFCTLASAGSSVVKRCSSVDDLIVDEAAAATEPELYIPFHLNPSRLLVVGDPMQLPATVMSRSAERLGLGKSLHERLMYDLKLDHIMLNVQYRMRPEISDFPSKRFYKGRIANGENVTSPSYKNNVSLLDSKPYVFVDVEGVEQQGYGGSYNNVAEANTVVDFVTRLQRQDDTSWSSPEKIRIITFYQAQASLFKRLLSERGLGSVVVATVDSSQGCEADIVIVSFVRSITENSRGGHSTAGFLSDDRRLNVALTRAKYQLICVGNVQGLKRLPLSSTLHALALDATERDRVHSQESLGLARNSTSREDSKRSSKYSGGKRRRGCRGGKSRKRKKSRDSDSQSTTPNKKGTPVS